MSQTARRSLDVALVLLAAGLAVQVVRGAVIDPNGEARPPSIALLRDPLSVPALRELGLRLDRDGDLDRADALLSFTGRRTWRDGPTEAWLLRRRLDQDRYREAFESADSLLRRDADGTTRPVLFELLIAAAADPLARPALEHTLAAAPWWRGDFLRALGLQGDAAGAQAVLANLALGATPPSPTEYAPFIDRLVAAGTYGDARIAWLAIARPRDPATADVRDGDFAGASDGTPFTWSTATGVGGSSETTTAPDEGATPRALRVDYDGFSMPQLPTQLLVLPAGRYGLSWRERLDPPAPERLFWRVRCADTNAVLARAPPPAAGWRDVTMSVETPRFGCAGQWLELVAESGERRAPVTAWYAAFRLFPSP